MRQKRKRTLWWWPLLFAAAWCLAHAGSAGAAPLVAARYAPRNANAGVLQLTIAAPAPSMIIVSLTLPQGYDILGARPTFKKRSRKSRQIKWLLKEVTPGKRAISFQLSAPFSFSQLHCIVQYMEPGDEKMITLKVKD